MNNRRMAAATGVFALILIALLSRAGQSQDKKPDPQDMQTMRQAWAAYMTPGAEHQQLQKQFVGTWTTEVKTLIGAPEVNKGTTVNKMMLGGRFLQTNYQGTSMGQKFEGVGMTGYDNAKKKYFGTWVDSKGTGMMTTEGTYDPPTQTYLFVGEMSTPDGGSTAIREVLKVVDDNTQSFEMYITGPDGKEMKTMEISYTRKK